MEITSVKFMLMVQDMARAIRFYHDVIGLEVQFESPEWTELAYGDAIVALHGGGKGEFRTTRLSFQVKDIRAACREITAGGGKIAGELIILAEIVDTEGNQFSLTEYLPTSPEA